MSNISLEEHPAYGGPREEHGKKQQNSEASQIFLNLRPKSFF